MLEYYTRPFMFFHKHLERKPLENTNIIRRSFWSLIPEGQYSYFGGKQLFELYLESLERQISIITCKCSAAYWLHISRRILPNSIGKDKSAATIFNVRNILNSCIQKYGKSDFCKNIGKSKEVDVSAVFNGLLLSEEFQIEREILELAPNQLILTDFTHINLYEYYRLEQLCYEVWFCGAKMRALQKGAIIEINLNEDEIIKEYRTNELNMLINSYDDRDEYFFSSATGTVFTNTEFDKNSDIFIPILNTNHTEISSLNEWFEKAFYFKTGDNYIPNFLLVPISLKKYMNAHMPFQNDFKSKNDISFQLILLIITSLCFRYFYISISEKNPLLVKVFKRGYEGPWPYEEILNQIVEYQKYAKILLDLKVDYSDSEIENGIKFLSIQIKTDINLMHFGTLKLFIPVGEGRLYIDYSIIASILNNMFYNIDLNKHNFRGLTLESALNESKSYLPTKPCRNLEGKEKQIDFSIKIDNFLIIGECKVVAKSIGFHTGDINALQYRNKKVIERGLAEVDVKAKWLSENPIGKNYKLENIDYILPIAISPFKEFIPSNNPFYWVNEVFPRVITIAEVKELIKTKPDEKLFNLVKVKSTHY